MRYDGGAGESFTYTNPEVSQVLEVTIGTGTAGTEWSMRINDLSEGTTAFVTFLGDASTTTTALNLATAWNLATTTDRNLFRNWAVAAPAAAVVTFPFAANNRRYEIIVTPAAGGAAAVVDITGNQPVAEIGVAAYADNTAATLAASRMLIPASSTAANFRGVIERTDFLAQQGAPNSTFDFWPPGKGVPVRRQGRMWVHVGTAVNPTSVVGVDTAGTVNRLGTFGDAGSGDYDTVGSNMARYLTAAAAGERAVLEVYGRR